ncbi:efflux RND transporter periplasmic adaptor subunit, partial [Lacticaseibacillus rhamnosus]
MKATIQADEAAIESAQTQFDYTTIRAPTDGRMGIRQIDPGNFLRAKDTTG